MDKMSRNALKRARISKGVTQEKAAEMVGYSVDAIQAWEAGTRRPSPEVVELLAMAYDAYWMPAMYWRELSNGVLEETFPAFQPGVPLPQAVAAVLDKVLTFTERHADRRLIAMAADGRIDDQERTEYDAILEDLQAICQAAMELNFSDGRDSG